MKSFDIWCSLLSVDVDFFEEYGDCPAAIIFRPLQKTVIEEGIKVPSRNNARFLMTGIDL